MLAGPCRPVKQGKFPSRIKPGNTADCDVIVKRRRCKCQITKREGAIVCVCVFVFI